VADLAERVTARIVGGGEGSLSSRARARRFERFVARFPQLAEMRVLDLGGELQTWRQAGAVRPREVVLLNLESQVDWQIRQLGGDAAWIRVVAGDACAPPPEIAQDSFDLVFSNSVIEHVGDHERRQAFAHWTRRLATHYWVQTPDRYFPVEPHWVFPGFQFLPVAMAAQVMRRWPIGNFAGRTWSQQDAVRHVLSTELLTVGQMRDYFPDGTLLRERWAGMTKSIIATG
jgi:hypothetical protein